MDRGGGHPPLTGREVEVTRLQARLDVLVSGRGSLLLVPGESGMGKTRLAMELASIAGRAGIRVAWGRCPDEPVVPLGPWAQVLRAVDGTDLGQLAAGAGGGSLDLDALRADAGRRRFFDVVVDHLRRAAPLVVVLDDVERADAGSLALLRQVAAQLPALPVLLLVTYRDSGLGAGNPLRDLLDDLLDAPGCDDLELSPLPAEAAIDCAAQVAGRRIDPERLVAVIARSGGNPFFIGELVRATAAGVDASLPRSVGPVIRRRLTELGTGTRQALDALSVLGGEAEEPLLAGLLGLSPGDLSAQLRPAADARFVEVDEPFVRFTHALIGEVVGAGLDPGARATLHRAAFDLLQQADRVPDGDSAAATDTESTSLVDVQVAADADAGARLLALAHHALAAEAGAGAGLEAEAEARSGDGLGARPGARPGDEVGAGRSSVDASVHVLAAGAWCERRFAYDSAAALYARALTGPSGRVHRAALLLARGDALVRAGLPVEARPCFEDARQAADGDAEVLRRAGIGLGACVVAAHSAGAG